MEEWRRNAGLFGPAHGKAIIIAFAVLTLLGASWLYNEIWTDLPESKIRQICRESAQGDGMKFADCVQYGPSLAH